MVCSDHWFFLVSLLGHIRVVVAILDVRLETEPEGDISDTHLHMHTHSSGLNKIKGSTVFFWKWLHLACVSFDIWFYFFSFPSFLVLDNIFAAAMHWWSPVLSRVSPERLQFVLSIVSIVTFCILHFHHHTDGWSPWALNITRMTIGQESQPS